MESRKLPAFLALVGAVVAVALFLVLKDDTADEDATVPPPQQSATGEGERGEKKPGKERPAKPEIPAIEIKDGKPVGGVQELEFRSGEEARFAVKTDQADELHFHGYDLYIDVAPGKPTEVEFKADIEGVLELESHTTGELLAEISVVPS